jgi:23S rRNA pseudouridine1911/1915/1917 synthase
LAMNRGYEYRDRIADRWNGVPVLAYLSSRYRHSSEAVWNDRLEKGAILLEGFTARADTVLKAGKWLIWRRPPWDEPDVPLDYAVLYEDESILAVAKPSGLPMLPAGGFLEHTLLSLVRRRNTDAAPIHRLGRGTSGVVLFARTRQARSSLSADLRQNTLKKIYRALARGNPTDAGFTVTVPIGPVPHARLGTVHAASAEGKPALSVVRVLEHRPGESLLEVQIQTGRPHQIRIHLAAAGHPLVGDPLYTAGGLPLNGGDALPGDIGYRLHAERIILRHPASGALMEIWCSPPPDLRAQDE